MHTLTTESIDHIIKRMTFRTELYTDFLERVCQHSYMTNDFTTGYAQGYLHAIDFAMGCIETQKNQELQAREDFIVNEYSKRNNVVGIDSRGAE